MKILIVEDAKAAVEAIKDAMSYTEGMQVVGTTDSATQGLKLVEAVNPHAIILDLELNEGDGLNFLKNLSTLMLNYKPFVLVTTNTTSKTVHDIVRNNGGDFIYTKNTLNYNPHALISILQSVDDYLEAAPPKEDLRWVSRTELRKAIAKLLAEISFMPSQLSVNYIIDAILLIVVSHETNHPVMDLANDVYPHLMSKYINSAVNIEKAMRGAIDKAWTFGDPKLLQKYYPFPINSSTGSPKLKDFLFGFAQNFY